jgi:hypothetical protein
LAGARELAMEAAMELVQAIGPVTELVPAIGPQAEERTA